MNLAQEFEKRKPWITKFRIHDMEYGGTFDAMHDTRIEQFFECFPNVHNVLELGSLEGGHSFGLAGRPTVTKVVALEGRPANVEKSLFVRKLLHSNKVEFIEANLQNTDLSGFGQFDAVFCSGLLYHLPEPWKLIRECSKVSRNLFIWTHYANEKEAAEVLLECYRGRWYQEGGLHDPLSGLSEKSFWLTLGSLITVLSQNRYRSIRIIENSMDHPHGPCVTLAAGATTL